MIDTLDSRALRRTDCFGQRFMRAGSYAYNICPAHSHAISGDQPFTITVKEGAKNGKMKQHNVLINRRESRFDAAPHDLTIHVGDLVLWNCVDITRRHTPLLEIKTFSAATAWLMNAATAMPSGQPVTITGRTPLAVP